jgi:multiple sugar transport system substrate-binding protein
VEFSAKDEGTVLMRNWPYAYSQLGDELSDAGYGVTRLPGAAALGGQSLAVAANSVRSDDARKLIEFLTHEKDSQTRLLEKGFAPALRDAYGIAAPDDLDCADHMFVSSPASAGDGEETEASTAYPQSGYRELLWCALEDARPRPVTAHYLEFSRTLQRQVRRMLVDGRSPDIVAGDLHAELPDALSGRH